MSGTNVKPAPTQVDTTAQTSLGNKLTDSKGNRFVYLKGVAGVVAGDFVVYDVLSNQTIRAVANSKGPGGFSHAAIGAGQFGWFQIEGWHPAVNAAGAIAINSAVGTNATTGSIGASAAGAKIENVFTTAAAAANKVAVMITAQPYAAGLG